MSNVTTNLNLQTRARVHVLPELQIEDANSEGEALERLQSLQEAFAFFNETSSMLADSYRHLEARVAALSKELEEAREEKVHVQKQKKQIAHRMQTLLDFLPGGVIVLDSRGVIVESNPAARKLLDDKLNGELWRDVIRRCFKPRNDDGFEVSTHAGRRISLATEPLENKGQIILLTDQTETRQLQQSLYHQQRLSAMGKMASALAHQIRTPLSAALLYAGHLCRSDINVEQQQQFSKKIFGRLQHMEKQIRDMMLFVRSELPLNDLISVADLELGLREAMDAALLTHKSRCHWENYCASSLLRCNREALVSAMMNLVNNALEACGETTELRVRFSQVRVAGENRIQILIKDQGPGMDAELLQRVKELFVTTKSQGTGLGLAVVMSVAKAHGGEFRLESEAGKGTEAILLLPGERTSTRSCQTMTSHD